MDLSQAKAIAQSYEERLKFFTKQHELLLVLLARTSMLSEMKAIYEAAEEAEYLNKRAGWLDIDNARDAFDAVIKHDQQGMLIKTLDDVPPDLRHTYSSMSAGEFSAHLAELREQCRLAYDEMVDLRSDLTAQLTDGQFFDQLIASVDDLSWPANEVDSAEALFTNLANQWEAYVQLGMSLVQMANESAGGDFDPSLMSALMFDE